jgi:hypothetical protein
VPRGDEPIQAWEQYSDSYVGPWGGLSVVSVWEFWVRLEIVGWDFIKVCLTFVLRCISEPTELRSPQPWTVSNGTKAYTSTADRTKTSLAPTETSYGFQCRHSKDL